MSIGRAVSATVSCVAVLGCAAVVVGMARAGSAPKAEGSHSPSPTATRTARPAFVPPSTTAAATSASTHSAGRPTSVAASASRAPSTSAPASSVAPLPVARSTSRAPVAHRTTHSAAPTHRASAPSGRSLPLHYGTGSATRVITVTAGSAGSTTATVQAWTKVSTGRWKKYGSSVHARVGSDGIGSASETRSKTPAGSFTLTQAFGRNSDPGTRLPYFKTKSSDYWISSAGSRYNTHQRCSSCGYDNGVNERLYYTTPYYNYAVVIDYNTRNAPGGVKAGKGSAFFLHVSVGSSTAGCVAIPQSRLVSLMRWLTPSAHPRILIGVT